MTDIHGNDSRLRDAIVAGLQKIHNEAVAGYLFKLLFRVENLGVLLQALLYLVRNTPPGTGDVTTEYGQLLGRGGVRVRSATAADNMVYPLGEWLAEERRKGSSVYRRRVVVVEPWTEITREDSS